jgi:hypothetical protein
MYPRVLYAEYLAEARERVCGHCPQRAPDRLPFTRACRRCGIELQLPQLVEAIRDAGEACEALARRAVCARCQHLDQGGCPCPVAPLTALLVRAVRAVEARREQRRLLHRRVLAGPRRERIPVGDMIRAYETATGVSVGCD